MAANTKTVIYVDALALVPQRKSGIGYTLEQTLKQLIVLPDFTDKYEVVLVVPLGKAKYLAQYRSDAVSVKTIYLPARVLELLLRTNICPPLDWFLGAGVYLFPNYRNWSVWKSWSMTYVYDMSFIKFPQMVKPNNQKYLSRYIGRWASRTDKVLAITQAMQEDIEKCLNISYVKIDVVPCGVDEELFYRRGSSEVAAVKQKYSIPFEQYMLFVGNIEPRKNLSTLLEAYDQLPATIQEDYGVVIVGGDGWLNESFNDQLRAAQSKDQNIIKVKDYVVTEDLPALYSGAAALVHPAVYEGFGITPLEAMACETPVVVSDIAAIHEVTGDAALYFDTYKPAELVSALTNLLDDKSLQQELALRGKQRAASFTWHSSAKILEESIADQLRLPLPNPLFRRLKAVYVVLDVNLRALFGEKVVKPYRPVTVADAKELQSQLYADFLNEQPSRLQSVLLRLYQASKHRCAKLLRKILRKKQVASS